jgi:hypothetical protein
MLGFYSRSRPAAICSPNARAISRPLEKRAGFVVVMRKERAGVDEDPFHGFVA